MEERGDQLITSAFTFGEVLAGPYRIGAQQVAGESKRLLRRVVSEVIPFTVEAADHYARIRGSLGVPPADAIHLACAAQARTDLFLTNDNDLVGKIVPGIHFIASLETKFF
jgi:predicted nucleic acid-binding protein